MAHLCGLCLALRGEYGQFARVATNYDGLIISVLTDAQSDGSGVRRRTAGPCPLRRMRGASVAQGEGARLAATVSLVLASAKVRDHVADGDGWLGHRPLAAAAGRVARGWGRAGADAGGRLGFDAAVLLDAVGRQPELERATGYGSPLLAVTEPTETATGAAFAHTAVLAGRPENAAPLAEAGRLFGRLAHLLDAVEDVGEDAQAGAWNPVTVTGTGAAEVRRLCDDAVHGIRLALSEVEFADGRLARILLGSELERAVRRAFAPGHRHGHGRARSPFRLPWPGRGAAAAGAGCAAAGFLTGGAGVDAGTQAVARSEGRCPECTQQRALCEDCGVCSDCCACHGELESPDTGDDGGSGDEGGDSGGEGGGDSGGDGGCCDCDCCCDGCGCDC